jgi:hypothetical protein
MGKGGLSFLQKKSWNTSNLSNVEKVWKAEKKNREETKRLEQLRREIEQERQREHLRDLQRDAGLLPGGQERMGWMVSGPAGKQEDKEQYLLGKEFELKEEPRNQLLDRAAEQQEDEVDMSKIREDPLLVMMARERAEKEKEREKRARNTLSAVNKKKESKKEKGKAEVKELKYGLLERRISPQRYDRSRSRSSDRDRKRVRDDSRSRSRDRYRRKERAHSRSRSPSRNYRSRNRDYSRSRSRSRDRDREYSYRKRDRHSRRRSRSRSRSYERSDRNRKDRGDSYHSSVKNNDRFRPSKLTQEEREERLRQMQTDASNVSHERLHKQSIDLAIKEKEDLEWRNRGNPEENPASFLQDMSKKVFLESEDKLSDRLKKNRHYLQSSHQVRDEAI